MIERNKRIFLAKCAIVLAVPAVVLSFSGGPPAGHTGAPADSGGRTCTACHAGTAVNGGGGNVALSFDGGNTYTPGTNKRVTITITDSAASAWGFQATARLASDEATGQAGSLVPAAGQRVICSGGGQRPAGGCPAGTVEFIEHTSPSSTNTITFEWTPPATAAGDVKFYVAGNAANGNGQNSGDHIYNANATLTAAGAGGPGGPRPSISQGGVANAGSGKQEIASGTWVSIFGSNLAAATRVVQGSDITNNRLPTALDGVSVEINGTPGFLAFVSPTQINVLAPEDQATGQVRVEVVTPQGRSEAATVNKVAISPAFLPFVEQGTNKLYVAARHGADNSIVGKPNLFQGVATTPARPGETIVLYGVGFGPTNPATLPGEIPSQIAPFTSEVVVRFGDAPARVDYAGVSPGSAGLHQLNVVVPATVPSGDVPVTAEISGSRTQENIFITVQGQSAAEVPSNPNEY
ncbi:MAG: choice-of-anchor V domain-containing protein [Bryobacteraceae bacterium]